MAYGAYIQSIALDASTATESSLAFPSNLGSGNTLVVGVRFWDNPGTVVVSDSRGHTFSSIRQVTTNPRVYWWFVPSSTSGADIVTVTTTNAVTINWMIGEYEGASNLHAENGSNGSGTAVTSGNVVTSVAVALIVGLGACDNQRSFTPGGSFTEREELEQRFALEDRVTSSAGTYTATWTLSSSDTWTGVGGAFVSSAGGGGTLFSVSVGGVISPSGTILKRIIKVLLASITPSAIIVKQGRKSFFGAFTPSATLVRNLRKQVAIGGVLSTAGALVVGTITGTGVIHGIYALMNRRRR